MDTYLIGDPEAPCRACPCGCGAMLRAHVERWAVDPFSIPSPLAPGDWPLNCPPNPLVVHTACDINGPIALASPQPTDGAAVSSDPAKTP